jgi:hypothetical protein
MQVDVRKDLADTKWWWECEVQPKAHQGKTKCFKDNEYKQHSNK